MKTADSVERKWEKTRLQNLVRNSSSGRYYARLYRNGKEVWKSLKTSHFSVAEARLTLTLKEHRQSAANPVDALNSKMTFGEAAELHMGRTTTRVDTKRRTKAYWIEVHAALLRSLPGLGQLQLRQISPASCRDWAISFSKRFSATRYNGTLSHLRRVFEVGSENGILHTNPASVLKRRAVKPKQLQLPTRAQFTAFIAAMRGGTAETRTTALISHRDWRSRGAESRNRLSWLGETSISATMKITVRGDPEEATKNGEIRRVPMIPEARKLFERIKTAQFTDDLEESVFAVRECQQSMTRAAKVVGMGRITHRDLQHFFATICTESGVDISTVSRWLGRKDGGALARRTIGHLRRERSVAQA